MLVKAVRVVFSEADRQTCFFHQALCFQACDEIVRNKQVR